MTVVQPEVHQQCVSTPWSLIPALCSQKISFALGGTQAYDWPFLKLVHLQGFWLLARLQMSLGQLRVLFADGAE